MNTGFAFRTAFLVAIILAAHTFAPNSSAQSPTTAPTFLDQGINWTPANRKDFYSRDQGSRMMPLAWMLALKQANGEPFMADSFARYGYLPNEQSIPVGLPVGFTSASTSDGQSIGMTCAACHTRQIEVNGIAYRIDGGPGIVDFQSLLADLDAAVNTVRTNPAAFADFANAVLGASVPQAKKDALKSALATWHVPYHTLMSRALPNEPWGFGRLDAVSMIFNRLTGLDLGTPQNNYMIPDNIKRADAPVRYPFLWNAAIQDKTQWPGFADNGNNLLGLARNVGEVYGVFGVFRPTKGGLLGVDYLNENSVNFQGLDALEDLIRKIGPPKWPWAIDMALADAGRKIFDRNRIDGGCAECHGIRPGKTRFFAQETWDTPVQDVGTDSREHSILKGTVDTGVLKGARISIFTEPLGATDTAFNVLTMSVGGSILQHYFPLLTLDVASAPRASTLAALTPLSRISETLKGAFAMPPSTTEFPYESRVLKGIWATAPYLHNGSVATLADLLKPATERAPTFAVGSAYDIVNVGLAANQPKLKSTITTTDCSKRDSGNSRCGHEFGTTTLSVEEKRALLEYLKVL